jgi:hypothetical protein
MQPFEKYSPKRINKDIAPDALDEGGNRRFSTGDLLDAVNCRFEGNGSSGVTKGVKGNVLKALALDPGANRVIGSFKNEAENTVLYIIWNEGNVDRVVEYSLDTNVFTTLLNGDLKLEKEFPVSQGGVIDDILLWNDKLNKPRSISISKAKAGGYTAPYSEYEISLATRPPLVEPVVNKSTDVSLPFNNLTGNTWQVTNRYVYHDNRISTVGPSSKLTWIRPFVDVNTQTDNELTVDVAFPVELAGIVSRIEVIAREGNTNNFFVFEEIKNPTLATYQVKFNNFGKKILLPIDEVNRLYDYIPDQTEGFEVLSDRVFTMLNKTGFDIDDSTFDFTVTLVAEAAPGPVLPSPPYSGSAPIPSTPLLRDGSYNNKRYLKGGGTYVIGLVFESDFGKTSFVKKQKRVVVPFDHRLGYQGNRYKAQCVLTGTPPAGVTGYKFVISEELFYQSYFQARLWPLLYIRDIGTDEADNTDKNNATGEYTWGGKLFYDMDNENANPGTIDSKGIKYVYWMLPVNSPFVPDSTHFVRFSTDLTTGFVPVLGIVGNYLVTEFERFRSMFRIDSPVVDQEPQLGGPKVWQGGSMAEIFKMKESSAPSRFYECGHSYQIVNGAFSVGSATIYGDTYNVRLFLEAEYLYNWVTLIFDNATGAGEVHSTFYERVSRRDRERIFIESPSGLFSSTTGSQILTVAGRSDTTENTGEANEFFFKSSLDYNKIASDKGRVHTVFDEEKQRDLFNVVGFSNTYVQNTFINGLNTFLAASQYPLPVERSRTRALKRAGRVMVAIHETQTSTLYIGEGIIRQGEDFITAKIEQVVGDDHKLDGGYGTINPESVLEAYDNLFYWDGLKGAIVRYTKAGMYPVSNYGMRNYFFNKARQLFPYRKTIKIITGFDYAYDEFLITFPDVPGVPSETWAFNIFKNEWRTRYNFIPEWYASINLSLISFKDGQLWIHDQNPLYNNFYGVQYTREYTFAANPQLGKDKRWFNAHVKMRGAITPAQTMSSEFDVIRVKNPNGQESYTPAYEFNLEQGKWNGPILKDINTPGIVAPALPLRSGDDISSDYLEVTVKCDRLDEAPCSHVNIVYTTEEFSV